MPPVGLFPSAGLCSACPGPSPLPLRRRRAGRLPRSCRGRQRPWPPRSRGQVGPVPCGGGKTLGREIRVRAVSSGWPGPGLGAAPGPGTLPPALLCLLPSRPQGGLSRPSRPPGPGLLAGPPARRRPRKDGARLGSPQAARGAQRPAAGPLIVTSRALAACRASDCQASLISSFCSHGRASAQQLRKRARTVASGFRSDSYAQLRGKDVLVLWDRSPVPGSPRGVGGTWLFLPHWSSVTSLEDKSL